MGLPVKYPISFSVSAKSQEEANRIGQAVLNLVKNVDIESLEVFAKASLTSDGKKLIGMGAEYVKSNL